MTASTPATGKQSSKAVDWEKVEGQYRAGTRSLREIATEHGITEGAIRKRAKRDEWERGVNLALRRAGVREKVRLGGDQDKPKAGYVYVIYLDDSAGERFFKIGMSAVFSSRFDQHQCASPFDICVAAAYFVGDMRTEERDLHVEFASKRVRGEWFRLSRDDLKMIVQRGLLV